MILSLIIFICIDARSQVIDPSLLMFLPTTNGAKTSEDTNTQTLEKSYYVKKKSVSKKRKPAAVVDNTAADDTDTDTDTDSPKVAPNNISNASGACPIVTTSHPIIVNNCEESAPSPTYEFPITTPGEQSFGQTIRNVVLGGDLELIEKYRRNLSSNDIRRNFFELSVAPQYSYNASQSNYFYRNYNINSPAMSFEANVWVTPFFGVNAAYTTTLLGSVSDSPTQNNLISVTQQTVNLGIKFRRFFSHNSNSASLSLGVNYLDHQFQAPIGDSVRMSTRNRGAQFFFDFTIPQSKKYFWNLGFNVSPQLSNEETQGSTNFTSGQPGAAIGFGGYLGGEYRFTRQVETFFRFTSQLYRSQFSGNSYGIDPTSNNTVSNVSVSDVTYFFNLGVRFGR